MWDAGSWRYNFNKILQGFVFLYTEKFGRGSQFNSRPDPGQKIMLIQQDPELYLTSKLFSLAFSPCGSFLACSSNTETVHVFRLEEKVLYHISSVSLFLSLCLSLSVPFCLSLSLSVSLCPFLSLYISLFTKCGVVWYKMISIVQSREQGGLGSVRES